jgi:EF-hand domain pair
MIRRITLALVLAGLTVSTGISAEGKPGKKAGKPAGGPNPEGAFKKLDSDSDGKVTLTEFKAAKHNASKPEDKVAAAFGKMDTNSDKNIDLAEFKAWAAAHPPKAPKAPETPATPAAPATTPPTTPAPSK